jgi:UTP--glucose-1-phosphate uridylyltransferase
VNTFLTAILRPDRGWTAAVKGASVKDCWTSIVSPVFTNRYTYVGIGLRTIPARPVDKVGARMSVRCAVIPAAGLGTRFLPATKAVPKELLPIGDTPLLQIVIDEALGAGIDHVVVVSSHSKPGIEAYFEDRPEVIEALEKQGRHELAERIRSIGSDWRATIVYQDEPLGLGHAVGCARDAVGDQPFAVMLPDELMGDSSLLAHMNGVCVSSGGSVVALKRVAQDAVGAYGVIEPLSPVDPDGVVAIGGMVEKPDPADAPSDLIIIGRYVLTPDVFDEIATLKPGAIGEIQLTDALRAQAARSPFHGVISEIERFDTGTPVGYIQAAIMMMMRRPEFGAELAGFVAELDQRTPAGKG